MTALKLTQGILAHGVIAGAEWVSVPRERLRETLTELKSQGYESYVFMTCVDHLATPTVEKPPERFELVYELRNMKTHRELRVRVFVPEDDPRVHSAHDIYTPANWDERETWDMFGIHFAGHPDLTRILMPDDWVGHPLRRDYPVGGEPVDFSEDHEVWQTAPPEA
ncbi:MAG TPA: NADH-quinone oxidoreductase subunit C [Candidatus Dormibacteraeota bacterium]|nr:NADH-quinone oxidoreductase subunit C [Candidatus Dormibacteraeota bacterium]